MRECVVNRALHDGQQNTCVSHLSRSPFGLIRLGGLLGSRLLPSSLALNVVGEESFGHGPTNCTELDRQKSPNVRFVVTWNATSLRKLVPNFLDDSVDCRRLGHEGQIRIESPYVNFDHHEKLQERTRTRMRENERESERE